MPQYDLTVNVNYRCRDATGKFYYERKTLVIQVLLSGPDDDYSDQEWAAIEANAPANCVSPQSVTSTLAPSAFAEPPPDEGEDGEGGDELEFIDLGELVTVYGIAELLCFDNSTIFRTVKIDVPQDSTKGEVQQWLDEAGKALAGVEKGGYPCVWVRTELTGPIYFLYKSEF